MGIIFAFLATQNTIGVDVNIARYTFSGVPLYLVALGSLLIGLLISSFVHIFDSLSSLFTIHSKDSQIKATEKDIIELKNMVHNLELENARLRGEKGDILQSEKVLENDHDPNIFRRLQQNFIP